mmetsp:Transcript_33767/g.41410  ORF Transcript_33767/g.41410 Transcript_33767/m.41410 type:complete len:100 (+) Transcript_33767:230-529(+)
MSLRVKEPEPRIMGLDRPSSRSGFLWLSFSFDCCWCRGGDIFEWGDWCRVEDGARFFFKEKYMIDDELIFGKVCVNVNDDEVDAIRKNSVIGRVERRGL